MGTPWYSLRRDPNFKSDWLAEPLEGDMKGLQSERNCEAFRQYRYTSDALYDSRRDPTKMSANCTLSIGNTEDTHLTDTMRFINNKARKAVPPIEIPHDVFDGTTHTHHLWRDIHHLCMGLAFTQLLMCEILVSLGQITSICDSWDIEVAEVARLIVDERNEGRYNECDPFGLAVGANSRQLVCIISYCPSVVGPPAYRSNFSLLQSA